MKKSKRIILLGLLAGLLAAILFLTNFRLVIIQDISMSPTLEPNDRVLCFAGGSAVEAGDIILFRSGDRLFIKRVIALSGQVVQIDPVTGGVQIDGRQTEDPFAAPRCIDDSWAQTEAWAGGYSGTAVIVPEGYVFCMGDNRAASIDSRDSIIGMIPLADILGTVLVPQ